VKFKEMLERLHLNKETGDMVHTIIQAMQEAQVEESLWAKPSYLGKNLKTLSQK
jgi:hypothetical protein